MALTYQLDGATRRIIIIVTGSLSVADILGVVDRQVDDGIWDYACLYDRRGMTTGPSIADIAPMARYIRQLETVHGPRGPVAVVGDHTGSVEVYSRLSKHVGLPFEVFVNMSDAERWLADRGHGTASRTVSVATSSLVGTQISNHHRFADSQMLTYRIDGPIVEVTGDGKYVTPEVETVIDAAATDPDCPQSPLLLIDIRNSQMAHSMADMSEGFVLMPQRLKAQLVAFVAEGPARDRLAQVYRARGETMGIHIEVFPDVQSARAWLVEMSGPPR